MLHKAVPLHLEDYHSWTQKQQRERLVDSIQKAGYGLIVGQGLWPPLEEVLASQRNLVAQGLVQSCFKFFSNRDFTDSLHNLSIFTFSLILT